MLVGKARAAAARRPGGGGCARPSGRRRGVPAPAPREGRHGSAGGARDGRWRCARGAGGGEGAPDQAEKLASERLERLEKLLGSATAEGESEGDVRSRGRADAALDAAPPADDGRRDTGASSLLGGVQSTLRTALLSARSARLNAVAVGGVVVVGDRELPERGLYRAAVYEVRGIFYLRRGAAPALNASEVRDNRLDTIGDQRRPPDADLWLELYSERFHAPEDERGEGESANGGSKRRQIDPLLGARGGPDGGRGTPVLCRASELDLRTVDAEIAEALSIAVVPLSFWLTFIALVLAYGNATR